jgi:hypothetical protein
MPNPYQTSAAMSGFFPAFQEGQMRAMQLRQARQADEEQRALNEVMSGGPPEGYGQREEIQSPHLQRAIQLDWRAGELEKRGMGIIADKLRQQAGQEKQSHQAFVGRRLAGRLMVDPQSAIPGLKEMFGVDFDEIVPDKEDLIVKKNGQELYKLPLYELAAIAAGAESGGKDFWQGMASIQRYNQTQQKQVQAEQKQSNWRQEFERKQKRDEANDKWRKDRLRLTAAAVHKPRLWEVQLDWARKYFGNEEDAQEWVSQHQWKQEQKEEDQIRSDAKSVYERLEKMNFGQGPDPRENPTEYEMFSNAKRVLGEALKKSPQNKPQPHSADAPPASRLKRGVHTKFSNNQVWTLDDNGKPKRVK